MNLLHSPSTKAILALFLVCAIAISPARPQPDDLKKFDGTWHWVEDRTEGKTLEQLGPPMSGTFAFLAEEGAIVLVSGHGSGQKNVRVALNGTVTKATDGTTTLHYTAAWKDGVLSYRTDFFRGPEMKPDGDFRREFRITPEGLMVTATRGGSSSVGLYKHLDDIAMPTPIKAKIDDVSWIAGNWVGTRSSGSSIEERWSPAKGGAMLGISRTVNTAGRMNAFEFLRIVEREGGLVYVAQPGGAPPTDFILTEVSARRAVFDNPRHDYPKRIVYELSPDGSLSATIGYLKGGTPRRFDFKRE